MNPGGRYLTHLLVTLAAVVTSTLTVTAWAATPPPQPPPEPRSQPRSPALSPPGSQPPQQQSPAPPRSQPPPSSPGSHVPSQPPRSQPPAPEAATINPVTAERLGNSWRSGCPVGPDKLRLVGVNYIGFDGATHRGELIVAAELAQEVADIFADLYADRFPIERMASVERYAADDERSMAANNTAAFNCRRITGGTSWSNHAYGRAIDINPAQNPYISRSGTVSPKNGASFVDRKRNVPGMIHADDATVRAFTRRGWDWGGAWKSPIDYQHFEKPARQTDRIDQH